MLRRPRTLLAAALGLVASGLPLLATATPAAAAPPAPVILNNGAQNGGNAQWLQSQGLPDDGGVRQVWTTFLVQHEPGRSITGIRADINFDGSDNTSSIGTTAVMAQQLTRGGSNALATSIVTAAVTVGKPGGFSCPAFGGATRSVDAPVRYRVVDSTGELSGTVNGTVRFVEDSNCLLRQDFPRLTSASQNITDVDPNQNITFTFSCDDTDAAGSSDDECDRANIRWRRLDDGTVSAITLKTGINDNAATSHTMSFPSQGHYVVEAQLGNENGDFPNTGGIGGWVRLGHAVVNDGAGALSASIAFPGANASSPPSVNAGAAISAVATAADAGGTVQVIEWDATSDGTFERLEHTVPTVSGGDIVHPALTSGERTQSIATATPGLRTVQVRVTDNGALDAADNSRVSLTTSAQLRVNAIPTAGSFTTSTAEDTATTIDLLGSDADNQPNALAYDIVAAPPASAGSLGTVSSTGEVTFTPAANFNGSTSFTYRVRDGSASTVAAWATSNTATVTIDVTAVNDAPTVTGGSITTDEDTAGSVTVTGSDVEDASLTFTVASPATNGNASCTPAGVCTYTPNPNFNGADSFVVRGTDSGGLSATATVSVTVVAVNDAPVAVDDTVIVTEDSSGNAITLAAGDVDDVTVSFVAPLDDVENGTLTCAGSACSYTPAPDYNGPDSFTFEVSDGELTDIGTITIDVTPVNDAPVAVDVPDATADEDVVASIGVGGTDVDGDPVTVDSVTQPANGSATVAGPNTVDYLGNANFFGIDVFDFTVVDGQGGSDVGTVTVTVAPVNDAPVAADQTFTVDEDVPTILSIAAGDVDGDSLTWSIVSGPANGTLVGSGPDLAYTGALNFNGTDAFVVQVDDGNGGVDTATVTVAVTPVNDQPVATSATVATDEDTELELTLGASDVDGDTLTVAAPVDGPSNGTLECTGTTCTYVPAPNFHGSDLFTFSVDDGNGSTDSASVTITVRSVNDAPVAADLEVETDEDTAVATPLTATDVDGDVLTFTVTAPGNGTVSGSGASRVYVPNPNSSGPDSFGFTASDGHGGSDSGTVAIVVHAVNDAPIATGGSAATDEDVAVSFQLGGTDVEGDALVFTVTGSPANGALACDAGGACTFTPAPGSSGTEWVSYSVSDGSLSSSGIFSISIAAVNDPPTATDTAVTTAEDTAVSITLEADDEEGDDLTYTIVSPPTNGTVECSGSSCVYTPAANYSGPDAFTWAASDGNPGQATATVSITVTPVNDAPRALDVAATTDEEVAVTFALLATDVEGDALTYSLASPPSGGTAIVSGSNVTYTPAVDFTGVDTFTFRVTDTSGASSVARATVTVVGAPLVDTGIVAQGAVAYVRVSLSGGGLATAIVVLNPVATLRTASGAPLAGRTLTFSAGGRYLCAAPTNAQGVASCGAAAAGIAALLNGGYQVTFAGDADHKASAANGSVIQVLAIGL
ncbi:MAG: tandem-95 repeat protein [Acidimicrobiia bacterium]|nr:tandem-95 repeat protein [Acidimicrobiia bacterium]